MLKVQKTTKKAPAAPKDTKVTQEAEKGASPLANVSPQVTPAVAVSEPKRPSGGFTLSKSVPLPARTSAGGKAKYPWAEMQPGDSFFVEAGKVETFYTLTSTARKKYNAVFIARKAVGDAWGQPGVDGVGVWRLATDESA
jgi:hypothetical protein